MPRNEHHGGLNERVESHESAGKLPAQIYEVSCEDETVREAACFVN